MYRSLTILVEALFFSAALYAQAPLPTPTPLPAASDDVVKISTTLIQIDVSATGRDGKVVRDLRPDEFEVFENGQKQDISNFSFVSNEREITVPAAKPVKGQMIPPPAPIRAENVRRAIALVVDDLTLSFESTFYARRALKKFIDAQMQPGDLVAIVRTGAGIGALQQFTNDKRQLYAAVERVRWNPAGNGRIGAFAPLEPVLDTGQPQAEPEPGERTAEGIQREFNDFREGVFATGTLGAVNYVVRGMSSLPGRKSVLLLSDGFKLFKTDAQGFRESSSILAALRRLADQANRASVVIYTMDARGLLTTGLTAEDSSAGRDATAIETALSDRRQQLFDTQDGLRYLAQQTGGFAIVNNNDLSGGIRRILDDQSYYLLGYAPDDDTFDPKTRRFNKLVVKVRRPGVELRYRSGFFGISSDAKDKASAANTPADQRLIEALTSPFGANEIPLRLNTLFGTTAAGAPFIRSLLHVSTQNLKFEDLPDGAKKLVFDIMAVGFGDNGAAVEQFGKSYTVTLRKDRYEQFAKTGFVYDFTFPIKKPGAYQLRVALRDRGSDRIGSANQFVEVPDLKKGRLTLSSVALENPTLAEFRKREAGGAAGESDSLLDTSLRRFKRGTVVSYGAIIYNSKQGSAAAGALRSTIRLYRDGTVIFEGTPQPVAAPAPSARAVNMVGSLVLGTAMTPGDYVLQIVVTDTLAKEKYRSAGQFVQFEIVE